MTRRLTPAQAQASADELLARLFKTVTDWDRALVEQAVEAFGADGRPFSCNDFRDLLPEMAHGHIGLAIRSMAARKPAAIVEIGEVTSTSPATHGKPIKQYVLAAFTSDRRAA
ncbi:hypothetical protein [Streptomyces sp. 5-6(2022)]|uniref:hypothetical protein n=1 Tax=Streptomyces sp. 5-6(2022) TaxID=2936510 RepID=UPI0023B93EA2|nr:hypothetical protein [Streptomyces sp. 5-6(2022)]